MTWRYDEWTAVHPLPLGASERASVGQSVSAGDVVATGTVYGSPLRVAGARKLGVAGHDLGRVMRVSPGAEVEKGAIIARTGRRFARAVAAPIAGRVAHVRGDGDLYLAPVVARWSVRATLDGTVIASTDAAVTVHGSAWCLQGVAAYGPDAVGALTLAVEGPADDIAPSRIDVSQRDRILVGGGRCTAEALARAHACGVAAIVAGAVPASGLRALFGDDVTAHGAPTLADAPTVLCLVGFGVAQLPASIFAPFRELDTTRAAIHTASARLFVFAGAAATVSVPATLALVGDWGAVRPLDGATLPADDASFPSERATTAVATDDGLIPAANVIALDAAR